MLHLLLPSQQSALVVPPPYVPAQHRGPFGRSATKSVSAPSASAAAAGKPHLRGVPHQVPPLQIAPAAGRQLTSAALAGLIRNMQPPHQLLGLLQPQHPCAQFASTPATGVFRSLGWLLFGVRVFDLRLRGSP